MLKVENSFNTMFHDFIKVFECYECFNGPLLSVIVINN